jgi:hypothetical protein
MLYAKSILFALLSVGLLAGCSAPAPAAAVAAIMPASTSLPPTEVVPLTTSMPNIPGVQVSIPAPDGAYGATINATITGDGDVGVIIANSGESYVPGWAPLVEALDSTENLRIVTFEYRDKHSYSTVDDDLIAVLEYLRVEGIKKTICIGADVGSGACANLRKEPEMIGMVLIATLASGIESSFPKLFLTARTDNNRLVGGTEQAYEQSTEPKELKSYSSASHGPGLFTDPNVGSQVLADITDFINGIANG